MASSACANCGNLISSFDGPASSDDISIQYVSGSLSGKISNSISCSIGDFPETKTRVGLITSHSRFFSKSCPGTSGILGMAYSTIARKKLTPLFDSVVQQLGVHDVFGIQLCSADIAARGNIKGNGVLTLGEAESYNPEFVSEGIFWTPIKHQSFYVLNVVSYKVDGKTVAVDVSQAINAGVDAPVMALNEPYALLDSGTTSIVLGSKALHKAIVEAIKESGMISFPDAEIPQAFWSGSDTCINVNSRYAKHVFGEGHALTIELEGTGIGTISLHLSPQNLFVYSTCTDARGSSLRCLCFLLSASDGEPTVFGMGAMMDYHVIHDRITNRIGFSEGRLCGLFGMIFCSVLLTYSIL